MTQGASYDNADQSFCSNCGERLAAGAQFCAHCGAAVGAQARSVPTASGRPTRTEHIKYRNMVVQVVLAIVTFGIYIIYWYYVTLDELHKANANAEGAGMWTFLSIIPFVQVFAYWHHSFEYAAFVDNKYPGIAIFILWIVFNPAVWFLVQSDLNQATNLNAGKEDYPR